MADDGPVDDPVDNEDGDSAHVATAIVAPDAAFDDDELTARVAADDDDLDDDAEVEGLRAGEFVCRSCHLAKRDTQLADSKDLLCRDCA